MEQSTGSNLQQSLGLANAKWFLWLKAHQEIVAASGLLVLLLAVGIPYLMHNRTVAEKGAQDVFNIGQYYLQAQVDPKQGPFKTEAEKYQQAEQTFQRITTDYAGTDTAKIAEYYVAKCQYVLQQFSLAYQSFERSAQDLKKTPLGQEAALGQVLCLEAQNQLPAAVLLGQDFLKNNPNSFIAPEMALELSDIDVKNNNKDQAVDQLKWIVQNYQDSNWGKEAQRRLKDMAS